MRLDVYLNYRGNCEQAFRFYEEHLGGKVTMLMRHGEQPNASSMAPEWKNAVLHARMTLGERFEQPAAELEVVGARRRVVGAAARVNADRRAPTFTV